MLRIIERKRAELIEIVHKNGLSSSKTIKFSQELDHLLNLYNNYPSNKTESLSNL
ncbi:aspartyl-phosphate phosphatase Spo0E family protein [Bacillus sp. PS06]|uniref:aspartyl-phosphate phosphatase Spo0E family protein n=1 Tax=Bacillus sp. PS06 TaxID=2764176 RepID=UPI001CD8D31D|nr:aspartyl-phosphate phosphatase Spo0E family protein [Bacillus sp. PS06]